MDLRRPGHKARRISVTFSPNRRHVGDFFSLITVPQQLRVLIVVKRIGKQYNRKTVQGGPAGAVPLPPRCVPAAAARIFIRTFVWFSCPGVVSRVRIQEVYRGIVSRGRIQGSYPGIVSRNRIQESYPGFVSKIRI